MNLFTFYATTQPFNNINYDSLKGIEVSFINELILQKDYPVYLSELFEAKNVNEWLLTQGITSAIEDAILDFQSKYPNSRYKQELDALYDRWKASGTPAPDIKGTLANDNQFKLSNLKEKVVYM